MAQKFFPIMISVDWLSLAVRSAEVLHDPEPCESFIWVRRAYGTKQYKAMYDVKYVDQDGVLEPFGIFGAEPTLESWSPTTCTLKLDNHLLYREDRGYWLDMLYQFLDAYGLVVTNITRCDLAGDFLFLRDRVSGPALCERIKNFTWWKCGSVNIAEHYKMPYTLNWEKVFSREGIETDTFLQDGRVASRVETLTFGTLSSDAQVCVYDKTAELARSEVKIKDERGERVESAKEYIRDCHKAAGVYDQRRHTWRIEIRLRNKALFLSDSLSGAERPVVLRDLERPNITATYLAAADKYFRLVDATNGGRNEITPDYVKSMKGHKNRLPIVKLFADSEGVIKFCTKPYHEPANKYHRAAINRLDELGHRLKRVPSQYTKHDDAKTLETLMQRLTPIAEGMAEHRRALSKALASIAAVKAILSDHPEIATPEDIKLVDSARDVLERHYGTESPIFCKNLIGTLQNYSRRMERCVGLSTTRPLHLTRSARPSDSEILLDAADVLRGVFVNASHDERRADQHSLYLKRYREAIHCFNLSDEPTAELLNLLYEYTWSRRYITDDELASILAANDRTDFGMLVKCNFDLYVYYDLMHVRGFSTFWAPPILPPFSVRKAIPQVQYHANIQLSTL